jgi:negative regulator of flagellin synthesis FlgM
MTDTITNSNSINVTAKAAVDAVKQNNAGQASAIKPALTEAVSKAIDSTVELSGTLKAELAIAEYDAKKVADIRLALEEGNYPLDDKKIAESYIPLEKLL